MKRLGGLAIVALTGLALGSLALGATVRRMTRTPGTLTPTPWLDLTASPRADARPRWKLLWTQPVEHLKQLSLAPDGTTAWLDNQGVIRRLSARTGEVTLKSEPLPAATHLVAVTGGRVLAYARLNPAVPRVWVVGPQSAAPNAFDADGPLWSVAATPDGQRGFFGTGSGTIRVVSLLPEKPSAPQSWQLNARPETLAVSSDGSTALVGTWLPAGTRLLGGWASAVPDSARWQEVTVSADGSLMVALSGHGVRRKEEDLRLTARDATLGGTLWERMIPGFEPQVRVSADGQRIALSFALPVKRGSETRVEHRLTLLDRAGNPLCEDRGGRFFDPRLVALSALGERITVLDGDRALITLDQRGRMLSRIPFDPDPATGTAPHILQAQATPDGAYLLLQRDNKTLVLLQAVE